MSRRSPGLLPGAAGLAPRLLGAHLVVVLACSVSLGLVAFAAAPPIFADHMTRAGETDAMVRAHSTAAFESAFVVALALGTLVAVLTAAGVSALVVRRLATPVANLARSADALAAGDYTARVADPRLGPEFARLTAAFTHMADRLAHTEDIRRRLLSDLAHELRTPTSTLQAHVDGLEDGVVTADAATWQVMRDQLERLQRLSSDLGQLSAAEEHALSLDLRAGDLGDIAAAAVDAAVPRFQAKRVELSRQAPVAVPVRADPVRVQQVLANLLDNALRHTPAGGSVRVVARRDRDDAVVEVIDTGAGIAVDELDAVFDRFHRADPARSRADGGSGLGLTIARAIVVDHGGTLSAHSEGPGTGARFTVRLPVP